MQILDPEEMNEADRLAAAGGVTTLQLMRNAGAAVARAAFEHFPDHSRIDVLCGPGNNGGDGFVAARLLRQSGCDVRVWQNAPARPGSDADQVAREWDGDAGTLAGFQPDVRALVIDALYGAGLSRALEGDDLAAIQRIRQNGCQVLAVDLPSGVSGATGAVLGDALKADCTVTFFRKKPGHLLYPGRELCGALVLADIGISDAVLHLIKPGLWENGPALWQPHLPKPNATAHKYRRGHVAVLSGGATSSGAARLAAEAAARAGAGAVTVLSPPAALLPNAAHLTATMLRRVEDAAAARTFIGERKVASVVCGPGFGTGDWHGSMVASLLRVNETALVLDADAITLLARDPGLLQDRPTEAAPSIVLTPHEGEFGRLFPDIAADTALSKVDRARLAAERAQAVVILKGPDTVVAASDGRAAINSNGTVWLATAGSGDVLAGIVAALIAGGMPPFGAACAAVWVHAEAGREEGFGLTAEDLPQAARRVLARLISR